MTRTGVNGGDENLEYKDSSEKDGKDARKWLQRLMHRNPSRCDSSARCGKRLERPAKYTLACRAEVVLAPVAQLCLDPTEE